MTHTCFCTTDWSFIHLATVLLGSMSVFSTFACLEPVWFQLTLLFQRVLYLFKECIFKLFPYVCFCSFLALHLKSTTFQKMMQPVSFGLQFTNLSSVQYPMFSPLQERYFCGIGLNYLIPIERGLNCCTIILPIWGKTTVNQHSMTLQDSTSNISCSARPLRFMRVLIPCFN